MKVYLPHYEGKPSHNIFVQPGTHHKVSDWMDENGKPKMFVVTFKFGCAEVPDNLGQYMLDNELAQATRIIIPDRKALA